MLAPDKVKVPVPSLVSDEEDPVIVLAIFVVVLIVNVRAADVPNAKLPVWKFRMPV